MIEEFMWQYQHVTGLSQTYSCGSKDMKRSKMTIAPGSYPFITNP